MLTLEALQDLIHLRISEEEALEQLQSLTPDNIDLPLLAQTVACVQATGEAFPTLDSPVMDCCGTGGSGLPHFNTSTTVAFLLASAGVPVVKFGNRGFSSASGSFDLLEQLGFPEKVDPNCLAEGVANHRLAFLFAPQFYPKIGAFNRLRKTLKVRTLFNFIGPLLNPVQPAFRLLGVSHPAMQGHMAAYLAQSGCTQKAWIVHGESGLDEIDTQGTTQIYQVTQTNLKRSQLTPSPHNQGALNASHHPVENLAILKQLVNCSDRSSVYHRMVCLNAGAGLHIAGQSPSWEAGVIQAEQILSSGQVARTIEAARRYYEKFAL